MATYQDLLFSIPSMDSYNRGYGSGISNGSPDDVDGLGRVGSQVGIAIAIADKNDAAAQSAGFYAIAYNWNGKTVISYRGTDNGVCSQRIPAAAVFGAAR